ncbi:unnamed protein product [Lathyrus sativus]|nr:unnamed protein product [Lathyrus sativus]
MGMNTSLMRGKGLSTSQVLSLVMNKLYKQFVEKDTKEFGAFHVAILDTFNTMNVAVPGKHYDAPSYKDVKEVFKRWKESDEEDREEMFIDFMNKNVNLNKVDESMIITAIVAPPAAMVAKRTGQTTLPQLKFMNAIPDAVFVPSATVLALIAVKLLRLMFKENNTTSKAATGSHETTTSEHSQQDIQKTASEHSQQDIQKTGSNHSQQKTASDYSQQDIPKIASEHSQQDIQKTASESNATQEMIKAASDAHQLTPKGNYCALCKKVHD